MVPPASPVKEERKATRACQACPCPDQVEGMGYRAPLGPPAPLGSQATQMELWNASPGRQVTRVLPEVRGSRD